MDFRVGSVTKTHFFAEYGPVVYQIKGNQTYEKIHANSLLLHIHLTPVVGSKGKNSFFSESGHVAYQTYGE